MKIFHVYSEEFRISKTETNPQKEKVYPKWCWGSIITYKHKRSVNEYAHYIFPDGTRSNKISEPLFRTIIRLIPKKDIDHIRYKEVNREQFDIMLNSIESLSETQYKELYKKLIDWPYNKLSKMGNAI